MGHHLFIQNDKGLPVGDFDVALVKHFLAEGANQMGNHSVMRAIAAWEYQGPGVWVGIEEAALAGQGPVFEAGMEAARALGEWVSLDYLHENVKLPGGQWLKEQPTADVIAVIRNVKEHLT